MRSNSDPDILSKHSSKEEWGGETECPEHQLVFEERMMDGPEQLCRSLSDNDLVLGLAEETGHKTEPQTEVSLETAAKKIEELIGPEQRKSRGHHRPLLQLFKDLKKQATRKRVSSTNSVRESKEQASAATPESPITPVPSSSSVWGGKRLKLLGRSRSLGGKKIKKERGKAKMYVHELPSESSLDQEEGEEYTSHKPLPSTSSSSSSERPVSGTPSEPSSTPEM